MRRCGWRQGRLSIFRWTHSLTLYMSPRPRPHTRATTSATTTCPCRFCVSPHSAQAHALCACLASAHAHSLVCQMMRECPVPLHTGLPELTEHLEWLPNVPFHVIGVLGDCSALGRPDAAERPITERWLWLQVRTQHYSLDRAHVRCSSRIAQCPWKRAACVLAAFDRCVSACVVLQ